MKIEETRIIKSQGYSEPYIKTGGRWYLIETKPSLLDFGIATMVAVTDDFETDFANPSGFTALLPANPGDGRPENSMLPGTTDDPAVVKLARKFMLTGSL
jgi:hypothetical protein